MSDEYAPLRIPAHVDRHTAAAQLAVQAAFAGWELATVKLYADGTRHVTLRRPRTAEPQPKLSF